MMFICLLLSSTAYQAKLGIYIFIDCNVFIDFEKYLLLLLCSEKIIYCSSEIGIVCGILLCSAKKNIYDVLC